MVANVFLVTVDDENFTRTVASPVDLTAHDDVPAALAAHDSVRLWGVSAGSRNESSFEKMAAGDLVVFHRDGAYVGMASVGETLEDGWPSAALWTRTDAPLCFTLEDYEAISVPRRTLNAIFDYSEGYTPQGLLRVADDRLPGRIEAIRVAARRYTERHG